MRIRTVSLVYGLGAIALLVGCGAGTQQSAKPAAAPAPAKDPLEVRPNEELLKQLKVGTPVAKPMTQTLRVSGRVEADETRMARVSAPVTGRITQLDVFPGQAVKRGQVLATLYGTELSTAQFGFVKAVSQQGLMQRAAARAQQLLKADVIGAAEVQRREAELLEANAELSSAHDQLRVLGMSEEAIEQLQKGRTVNSLTQIVATIDGTVLERKVTIGQVVQPADTLFVIADLSQVWLVADVPEQQGGAIELGKAVEAEVSAFPGQIIRGKLSFVSSIIDPESRTVRTRMDLPNPKGRYKPAMLAMMELKDNPEQETVIPVTAVVREEDKDYVFIEKAPGQFVMRMVKLGAEHNDSRVLEEPWPAGQRLVVDGAFHLNNERRRLATQGS
jgi:cobalt-zinc-cadmium efflux system membrane fusion protein